MKIIALSGWKRSGKDSVAEYLVKEHQFTRLAFADKLKDLVSQQYSIPRSWLDDPKNKELPLTHLPVITTDKFTENIHNFMAGEFKEYEGQKYWTPRGLAILEGSVKRSVNSKYWVEQVINNVLDFNKNYVITDCRYISEYEQLKKEFGKDLITVRINRFDANTSVDPSENDLNNYNFDKLVENKGTLEELYIKLNEIIKM